MRGNSVFQHSDFSFRLVTMFHYKASVLIVIFLTSHVSSETVKRDLLGQQSGLEFLHLGNFGPISRLASHPSFSHLGLTSQQAVGFTNVLHQNGLLNPNILRHANGQPFWSDVGTPNGNVFTPVPAFDPYFLFLMSNYARFLPFGLGAQGFYGSTGLPRPKPLGVFKYNDKNS